MLSLCLVNVRLLPESRQLNILLCATLYLTCLGMYICQQKFKTENRTYLNLHFAVLFASRNVWYADLHPAPSPHSACSLLRPKSVLWGVQATPELEVDFYWYTVHMWSCATTIYYVVQALVCVYKNSDWMPCTGLKCFNAKKAMPISVISPAGYFLINIFFDDLHLLVIESIPPPKHLENSSAQWAIFLYSNHIAPYM